MPTDGTLQAALEEFRGKTGWQGLDAEDALEAFLQFSEGGKSETYRSDRTLLMEYQAEMVQLCRDLGCEPNTAISAPTYYGDLASEAIDNLKAAMRSNGMDPKGHTVLARNADSALLFTSPDAPTPFVIACGYDEKTGEWASGLYRSDLGRAWEEFQPGIVESASIRWQREDFEAALAQQGIEPTRENVNLLINETRGLRGWQEHAISNGWEHMEDCILSCDELNRQRDGYTLSSESRDMREAQEGLSPDRQHLDKGGQQR